MKIAIIGNGKMGAEVDRVARTKGIEVVRVFTAQENQGAGALTAQSLQGVDVCIEFTHPAAAVKNIEAVAKAGKCVVVGTTGWYERLDDVREIVAASGTGLIYAPNFSIGVNLLGHLLDAAARLFDKYEMYDVAIRETHHRAKADTPSGTALHLGRIVLKHVRRKTEILAGNPDGPARAAQLQVTSARVGSVVGEHAVVFDSEADTLELIHRSKNRSGFAHGALVAAAWVRGRKGVFTMVDVLTTE